ncbi:MAG: CoA transferase [Pseudomonadota bacterium]
MTPVSGPLNGVKILDLTHVWAGPLAVRFLADLGAEVVRVEAPDGRGPLVFPSTPLGGWISGPSSDEPWNDNALFVKLMRNRSSVSLDLKTEAGRRVFLQLASCADVLVENFSARVMPGFGLDYEALKPINPNLLYVSMPGFGQSGPLCNRVAFGPTVEAFSGFTQMMGYSADEPRNTAMALMDPVSGTNAVAAILTGLRQREVTGEGAMIEMSLHEGGVGYNGPWLVDTQLDEIPAPSCLGNRHPQIAPHGVYACAGEDQWIALACPDDGQWRSLCEFVDVGDAEWSVAKRMDHHDEIDDAISAWVLQYSKEEAAARLQLAGISAGPVNSAPDMIADDQVADRGYFARYERYDVPMPGNPLRIPGLDPSEWRRSPRLGEHNREVLKDWLDYSDGQIDALENDGVLADRPPA